MEGAEAGLLVTEVSGVEAEGASRTEAGSGRREATVTSLADAAQKRRSILTAAPQAAAAAAPPKKGKKDAEKAPAVAAPEVRVRRMHRRDLNRTWEFLKLVFRDVNRETVEYQRPRSKKRFFEVYEEEGEQLLFEIEDKIVGYAECAYDVSGADNWINPRYFEKRGMRPLYVDELAVHPDYQGQGVGAFMLDQLQHLARVRGCTHLVLEVAENNKSALSWYRKRNFFRLDAAIFLAQKLPAEPELLPPRRLPRRVPKATGSTTKPAKSSKRSARSSSRK
ncbi:MAG TPA: N-acetyltransferase [Vulgatibacter sp.]|nr:N-acetyltransferase [Vulgatibacter sp.]